jgi:diguanylate cyclase (GGDEF)-like protein
LIAKLASKYFIFLLPLYFCFSAKVSVAAFSPEANQNLIQHSIENLPDFDNAVIDIEKLMDTNALLALAQLKQYETIVNQLSLKQQINYFNLLAAIYLLQAQYHLVEEAASEGLELTLGLSSPSIVISELLYSRGFAYESIGKIKVATKDYENGLELAKSLHNKVLIATGLVNLGAIYYLTDQYESSLRVLNDAYNIAKQTNNDQLKGLVNSELGILYAHLNRADQSMIYFQQSYQFYKKANKNISSLEALVNIGINHLKEKEYQKAISVYQTIIEESGGRGQNEIMYNTYSGLSRAYLKKQNPNSEASYQYLLLSKQYMKSIEQHNVELKYYNEEAFVLFALERFEDVLVSIDKVEKILKNRSSLSFIKTQRKIKIIDLKSQTYFKLGYYQQAYNIQKQRLALIKALRKKKQISSIAEVRLALEVKQADLHTKLLENKQTLQEVALHEAEHKQQQQKYYLLYITVVALIFAWFLIKLIQDQSRLGKMSNTDMLTGIANRRKVLKESLLLFNKAKVHKSALSVLMIDIDHFKAVNDEFGHGVGDIALIKMVQLGIALLHKDDFFGRIGGEKFMVLLPRTSHAQAVIFAERLRRSVEQYSWDKHEIKGVAISVSIGVACSTDFPDGELSDIEVLINKADNLLYQAKAQGRNKVCG